MPTNYTEQQRQALLETLGHGRTSAIRAEDLARMLGYPTTGNQVQLRGLIKECIEVDNDLIGSSTINPPGFFIISEKEELEDYANSLESRARSDNQRRTALIETWNSTYPENQTDLTELRLQ